MTGGVKYDVASLIEIAETTYVRLVSGKLQPILRLQLFWEEEEGQLLVGDVDKWVTHSINARLLRLPNDREFMRKEIKIETLVDLQPMTAQKELEPQQLK